MSRGFAIGVNVATADDLTNERIADEVTAQGLLTALEMTTFLPAAIVAAQAMINAIGAGPFWVWLDGADNLPTPGETTTLRVTVSSLATPAPVAGAAPEAVTSSTGEATAPASPEPEAPTEVAPEPASEPAPEPPVAA